MSGTESNKQTSDPSTQNNNNGVQLSDLDEKSEKILSQRENDAKMARELEKLGNELASNLAMKTPPQSPPSQATDSQSPVQRGSGHNLTQKPMPMEFADGDDFLKVTGKKRVARIHS